jgi:hypothetical protein
MKITGLALIASALFGAQAMASEGLTIHCAFKDQPLFGVYVNAGPFEGFFGREAPAEVTVAGPRLHLPYTTTLHKTPIQTRTIVGVGYEAQLGENSSIKLRHIRWAPEGWAQEICFTGVYIHDGQETALVCE